MQPEQIYNPLKSITIQNVGRVDPKGLTVIVGPNSSGKTLLLRDVESYVLGDHRELVVCEDVEIEKPADYSAYYDTLIADGYLREVLDGNGNTTVHSWTPHIGRGGGSGSQHLPHLQAWYHNLGNETLSRQDRPRKLQFFEFFGPAMTTSLFLNRRLNLANDSGSFDYETAAPANELQALYANSHAKRQLTAEMGRTFGKGTWLDNTRGGKLCLRVAEGPETPGAEDRLEPEEMRKFRTVESEGDGFRSYACVCISLLLGRRPVCLIDEPEMCLHPPQAYALGRFIGRHGTSQERSTLVATHSSHVLRGILDETSDLQVLRLSRANSHFCGDLIPADTLKVCTDRPTTKIETILDGVFAEAVTIVESEGDRLVYGTTYERTSQRDESTNRQHDVHFVSVGGIGGIANVCRVYKKLKIPVAVIADLDLVQSKDILKQVLSALAHSEEMNEILDKSQEAMEGIAGIQPTLSAKQLKGHLQELLSRELDWTRGEDQAVRKQLSGLASRLSRSALLKRGGISNFEEHRSIRDLLNTIMANCRQVGLFLVPVGELEHWAADLMSEGPSKADKAAWATEAARRIRENTARDDDVWRFVSEVARYQRDEASRLGRYPVV